MMKPEAAETEFVLLMGRRGLLLRDLTAEHGIPAMLAYYQGERAEGPSLERDGDMLLYQFGTYDWGQGEFFELDITRQLILNDGEDDDILQLQLTFRFSPTASLRDLRHGNRWCSTPDELAEFETFIRASQAYQAVAAVKPTSVDLRYACAG